MESQNPIESSTLNIDLDEEGMNKEVTVTLTVGQLMIVKEFLAEHIHPKGYMYVELSLSITVQTDTQPIKNSGQVCSSIFVSHFMMSCFPFQSTLDIYGCLGHV